MRVKRTVSVTLVYPDDPLLSMVVELVVVRMVVVSAVVVSVDEVVVFP